MLEGTFVIVVGLVVEFLGAAVEFPGAAVEFPGAAVEFPGAAVEFPGAAVDFPGAAVEFPGAAVEFPGVAVVFGARVTLGVFEEAAVLLVWGLEVPLSPVLCAVPLLVPVEAGLFDERFSPHAVSKTIHWYSCHK